MTLDVEGVLDELGVVVTRHTGDELWALCPMHEERTGKPDRNPSWSINESNYAHKCFSCGYSGNLTSLYRDLEGDAPPDLEMELTKVSTLAAVNRAASRAAAQEVEDEPTTEEVSWRYSRYTKVPERLARLKGLDLASLDHYGVRWDTEFRQWVLPVTDADGELVGFQYRQKGFEDNWPAGMSKGDHLFGYHLHKMASRVALVESPLDAIRLFQVGVPAVASYGAWVSDTQLRLLDGKFRYVILALDNDAAGLSAAESVTSRMKSTPCIRFFYPPGEQYKDPGDFESDSELSKCVDLTVGFGL